MNGRIFPVIIFSIVFLLFFVGISSIASLLPSWSVVLVILELASLVMVAYWVYADDKRIDTVGDSLARGIDIDITARTRISSLEERLNKLERISILEKELNAMKKAEAKEEIRTVKVNKIQKEEDSLLDEAQIEEYRRALLERYKTSGFLHPEENLEYEIDRKMGLGKTRNKAIEELYKQE
jgi:hypothetical protein